MKANVRHVVLYAVDELGGRANGKTYLQKLCFFVAKLTDEPFGYRAHYYGPYSDIVSSELAFLINSGFLSESRKGSGTPDNMGWELSRYDYQLTEVGKEAVRWLDQKYGKESSEIREAIKRVLAAGELNYVGLSLAAKTIWVLEHRGRPMTIEGIADAARDFKWSVSPDEVGKASEFLKNLALVKAVGHPS